MKPNIGLTEKQRSGVVEILNTLLADEFVLYTKTRNYHWNVVGLHFSELHAFFQQQYEALNDIVDDVAERVRAVGGRPVGTLGEFLKRTRLKEHPGKYPDARGMLAHLLEDHETIIRHLRTDVEACAEKYGDMGTSDFLTELLERHEKMAWMLRASLEEE
jgi:starvation-inducible DNA-binding protein